MTEKINPIHSSMLLTFTVAPDEEHKRIMRKLMAYGYRPTFNKSTDYAMLRKIEIKQAEMETCISGKFITVTKAEQEKIQAKKKEKRIENNPELAQNTMKGQKLLGEQIMLAIQMKKDKEKAFLKKKEEDKRRTKEL